MRPSFFKNLGAAVLFLSCPALVHAHIISGDPLGMHHGFAHPFTGADHLLAMLAVGLWAAQQGGRALWMIPMTFVGVMSLGGLAGVLGASWPGSEPAIAISVLLLGLFIATAARFHLGIAMLLVGAFAFFHGYAHGHEMPPGTGALSYSFGFLLATLVLHGAGLVAGLWVQKARRPVTLRFAGAAIAAASICLFI